MNASLDFLKDIVGSSASAETVFYIADEATRASVVGAMPQAVINDGGIQIALTAMSQQESPDVLVVDLAGMENPEAAMRTLRTLCQPSTKIVGLSDVNDTHLLHSLVDAGATDYLVKPFTSEELVSVIEHAVTSAQYDGSTQSQSQTIFVTGVRGGVGASSLVTGMAWYLAEKRGINVAVVDLDLIFGTVALEFGNVPPPVEIGSAGIAC